MNLTMTVLSAVVFTVSIARLWVVVRAHHRSIGSL